MTCLFYKFKVSPSFLWVPWLQIVEKVYGKRKGKENSKGWNMQGIDERDQSYVSMERVALDIEMLIR